MDTSVSVVIPSFNRYDALLRAITSVESQTHKVLEIIVVDDCSTDPRYKLLGQRETTAQLYVVSREKNSRDEYGYANLGQVRNDGVSKCRGRFVAFLDDDDVWFPTKLERQLSLMQSGGTKFSCGEAVTGKGVYDKSIHYPLYLGEVHWNYVSNKWGLRNGFPDRWTLDMLLKHNCCITSSVIVDRELLIDIGMFVTIRPPGEDYATWKKLLHETDCMYLIKPCLYYDSGHGGGQWWL